MALLLLLFLVEVPIFPLFGASRADSSWIIGLVGALSGPKAPYGISQQQGASLAVEELNRAGGVNGRPLRLLAEDDRGNPGDVGEIAARLAGNDQVMAILGSTDSGCSHVLSMVAVKMHIPHVTCVATDPSLTRAGTPWTFRTLADDIAQAETLVRWLKNREKTGRIGILAAQSRYGKMGAQTVARLAKSSGFAVSGPRSMGLRELTDSVRAMLQEKPDVVVLWGLASDGLAAIRELHQQGFSGLISGGDGLASPAFFAQKTIPVEGVVVTCPYDVWDESPANRSFREAFHHAFGVEPDSFSAHAYDTVNLLADAFKNSDGTRAGVRAALAAGKEKMGATGALRFDETGNDRRPVRLAVCREGALQLMPTVP